MDRKWIVALVIAAGVLLWLIPTLYVKHIYDKRRNAIEQDYPRPFPLVVMDVDTRKLLEEIEGTWTCTGEDLGGPHADGLKAAGLVPCVSSLLDVIVFRAPDYAWFDAKQNERTLIILALQVVLLPVTMDGAIHVSADKHIALVRHSPDSASIYRDKAKGLSKVLWVRGKGAKEAAPAGK